MVLLNSLNLIYLVSITKIRPKPLTENVDKLNTTFVTGAPQKWKTTKMKNSNKKENILKVFKDSF